MVKRNNPPPVSSLFADFCEKRKKMKESKEKEKEIVTEEETIVLEGSQEEQPQSPEITVQPELSSPPVPVEMEPEAQDIEKISMQREKNWTKYMEFWKVIWNINFLTMKMSINRLLGPSFPKPTLKHMKIIRVILKTLNDFEKDLSESLEFTDLADPAFRSVLENIGFEVFQDLIGDNSLYMISMDRYLDILQESTDILGDILQFVLDDMDSLLSQNTGNISMSSTTAVTTRVNADAAPLEISSIPSTSSLKPPKNKFSKIKEQVMQKNFVSGQRNTITKTLINPEVMDSYVHKPNEQTVEEIQLDSANIIDELLRHSSTAICGVPWNISLQDQGSWFTLKSVEDFGSLIGDLTNRRSG